MIVDWLPWNHTFGGNHNFNMMLRNGGTLYIDEGKPVPALIGRTVANLREVSPTVYFNVPRGYAALLDHLEKDEALQRKFFARLDLLFYAAAALPQSLWDRLERLGHEGARQQGAVHLVLGPHGDGAGRDHGAFTRSTGPATSACRDPAWRSSWRRTRTSSRSASRAPTSRPGYFKAPELTAKAFDEEGWLRTGDAVRLADPANPAAGLLFDGRVGRELQARRPAPGSTSARCGRP